MIALRLNDEVEIVSIIVIEKTLKVFETFRVSLLYNKTQVEITYGEKV